MPEIISIFFSIVRPAALLGWLLLLAVIAGLWVSLNYHELQAYFAARNRRDQSRELVENLKGQKERLETERSELQHDGFATEKAVRERLMMARPGEKVIIIESPGDASAPAPQSPEEFAAPTTLTTETSATVAVKDPATSATSRRARKGQKPASAKAAKKPSKPATATENGHEDQALSAEDEVDGSGLDEAAPKATKKSGKASRHAPATDPTDAPADEPDND